MVQVLTYETMKIEIQLDEHKASAVRKILEGLQEAGLIQDFQKVEVRNMGSISESNIEPVPPTFMEQSTTDFVERYRDLVD